MTKYLFNEGIVWEDKRTGSYIVPYLIFFILFAIPAVLVWFAKQILAYVPAGVPLPFQASQFTLFVTITVCAVCGALALIILLAGIRNLRLPRLVMTPRRLCLMKGEGRYTEVRFKKIDAVYIRGNRIIISAGGKKVIRFGPVNDVYATRNAVVGLIEFEIRPPEDETIVFDKAEPIDKPGDVFDAEIQ